MTTKLKKTWLLCVLFGAVVSLAGCGANAATGPAANTDDAKTIREKLLVSAGSGANSGTAPTAKSSGQHADTAPDNQKGPASADGWGAIKGRFVYGGSAPVPESLKIDKDQATCGGHNLVDQSLEVGPSGGVGNVVVWITSKVKVSPKFDATKADKVVLDNKDCHFMPHAVGLRTGQTLVIKNNDPVAHNTKIDGQGTQINPLIPAGTSSELAIDSAENIPAQVSCSIHGWMHAWMVVRPNPYFAISDANGNFEIKDLPAGEWEFQVWQERAGYVTDATVGGQEVKWAKGHVKWTVGADKTTDLGEMKLAAAQFNK